MKNKEKNIATALFSSNHSLLISSILVPKLNFKFSKFAAIYAIQHIKALKSHDGSLRAELERAEYSYQIG